jgi:hypothetical protein
MATYALPRFSQPKVLRAIAPDQLLAFLRPYRRALISRGVTWPPPGSTEGIDYLGLIKLFVSPDSKMPRKLIDALYLVDEMATHEGMDALLEEVTRQGLTISHSEEDSPADVVVRVWLLNKDIVERKHAEQFLKTVRTFESYQTERAQPPEFTPPTEKDLEKLATDLDGWFERKNRGRGAKLIMCDRADGVCFLVRHGEPFKREESLEGRNTSSVCYRPLKYDVLIYAPQIGELRIHARSKGEKQLYRETFGKHLFGDEDIFPGTDKFTLEPLRELGEDSLSPADIEGIDWVKLREVQFYYAGDPWEIVTRKSDDIFALFKSRRKSFPEVGHIIRATFQIKFADSKTPRSVVIKPSNIAQFNRDDDSELVERWLRARGFIIQSGGTNVGQ